MIGKVIRVNKFKCVDPYIYIGRGTIFGNKYRLKDGYTRSEAIALHRDDLLHLGQNKPNPALIKRLIELATRVHNGETIRLGCYCGPSQRCHGDTYKEYIDQIVEEMQTNEQYLNEVVASEDKLNWDEFEY